MNIKKIKGKALNQLEGKYIIPIVAIIIYGLIVFLANIVAKLIYNENMTVFFAMIIKGLIYMGLLQIFIKVARNKKADIMDLFKRTDLFWKCAAITIILFSFTLLCGVLEVIAFNALNSFISYQTDLNKLILSFLIITGIVLCAAIAIFYGSLMISCSQVYYILYDNENMPVIDIFNKSMDIMENHRLDYLIYVLSFIGWIIVGILTLGILFIWIIPYIEISNVYFYDEVVKLEKTKKTKTK